jgi:hypothetical protein
VLLSLAFGGAAVFFIVGLGLRAPPPRAIESDAAAALVAPEATVAAVVDAASRDASDAASSDASHDAVASLDPLDAKILGLAAPDAGRKTKKK